MDNLGHRYQRAARFAEIVSGVVRMRMKNLLLDERGITSDWVNDAIKMYEDILIDSLVENGAVIWPCGEERVECSSPTNETPG